jgi:hypothetical protein
MVDVPVIPVGAMLLVFTIIALVRALDVPQALVAVTDKVPLDVGLNVTLLVVLVAVPPPL